MSKKMPRKKPRQEPQKKPRKERGGRASAASARAAGKPRATGQTKGQTKGPTKGRTKGRTRGQTTAQKAPAKRVKARAAMSKAAEMSRAELSIMHRMAELEPSSHRYKTLEAALAFKSSWIILGEHLADVARTSQWRGWGYASFERYCAEEVHVTAATAKKLVRSYQWLGAEAPEYLPKTRDGRILPSKEPPPGPLPDLGAVSVLAEARSHFDEHRVPEDAYLALKHAALEGETASALRRTLKEAIPAHLKPRGANDKVRHLRRALSAVVKVIDALREWDSMPGDEATDGDALIVEAERLRDAIAVRLPRTDAGAEDVPSAA